MDNFDKFYNEIYVQFYNTCKNNNVMSSVPIPYVIDENIREEGHYTEGVITLRESSIETKDEIRKRQSIIYHELTHYYDECVLKTMNYSKNDINIIMLTFSEIHAEYNGTFAFFGLMNLSVNKKIPLNAKVTENQTFAEYCALNSAHNTYYTQDILGFKRMMYFLGMKRALIKISKDVNAIFRAYNYSKIPEHIRTEISNIDKIININTYENINVVELEKNKKSIDSKLWNIQIDSLIDEGDKLGIDFGENSHLIEILKNRY